MKGLFGGVRGERVRCCWVLELLEGRGHFPDRRCEGPRIPIPALKAWTGKNEEVYNQSGEYPDLDPNPEKQLTLT